MAAEDITVTDLSFLLVPPHRSGVDTSRSRILRAHTHTAFTHWKPQGQGTPTSLILHIPPTPSDPITLHAMWGTKPPRPDPLPKGWSQVKGTGSMSAPPAANPAIARILTLTLPVAFCNAVRLELTFGTAVLSPRRIPALLHESPGGGRVEALLWRAQTKAIPAGSSTTASATPSR